jgi:hypothetical protein
MRRECKTGRDGLKSNTKAPVTFPEITPFSNRLVNRQSVSKSKNAKRFKNSKIEFSNRAYIGSFGVLQKSRKKTVNPRSKDSAPALGMGESS